MEIRKMTSLDDRLAVSYIYEESWKFAYKGILPQSYLDSIPKGDWTKRLDQPGRNSLILLENDKMIGTSSYGKARHVAFQGMGEIMSIYLLPAYIGKGYGKLLMDATADALVHLGYTALFLWVLDANDRAKCFYESYGFRYNGIHQEIRIGQKTYTELAYSLCIAAEHNG